jgi:HAD superfamily hydrolase (TIGR01549 family)
VFEAFHLDPKPFLIDRLIGVWNKNKLLAKPYDDTIEMLEQFKKEGYKLALVSNCPNDSVEPVLEKFDMAKYFDVIAFSWESGKLKTDKAMFEGVLKKLKVKKEDALVVGDSIPTDLEGAKNAGINAILLDRKGKREWPEKIRDLHELKAMLK